MKRAVCLVLTAFLALSCCLAAAETMTCIIPDGQYVNVRNRAAKGAATWGELRNGDTITPEGVTDGWVNFRFNGHDAYAMVKYFEIPENAEYVVVGDGRVRSREQPNGKRVDWVNPGDAIHVDAWRYDNDGGKWARAGSVYVSADYLEAVGDAS